MSTDFKDRVVLVTGGSSGLGLAIARAFRSHGARVVLLARDASRLDAAAESLVASVGPGAADAVRRVTADVRDATSAGAAVAQAIRQFGRLDVLVNAAGISDRGRVLDTEPSRFQQLWDLNFLGTVHCVRAAAGELLQRHGHVVNIGSLASKVASPYLGAYPASKFAVAAYSQQLRQELGPQGVHVLLVCPGPLQRDDAGTRYGEQAAGLPESARRPGGGAKLKLIDPDRLSEQIVAACQQRRAELVVPGKVRWLVALGQWFPSWADAIIRRKTGNR